MYREAKLSQNFPYYYCLTSTYIHVSFNWFGFRLKKACLIHKYWQSVTVDKTCRGFVHKCHARGVRCRKNTYVHGYWHICMRKQVRELQIIKKASIINYRVVKNGLLAGKSEKPSTKSWHCDLRFQRWEEASREKRSRGKYSSNAKALRRERADRKDDREEWWDYKGRNTDLLPISNKLMSFSDDFPSLVDTSAGA